MGITSNNQIFPANIANGASLSGAIDMGSLKAARISMDAGWDAAALTFQVLSDDGVTFQNLYDANGNEYTVQAAAGREIVLSPSDFLGFSVLKIRSGTSAAPVNQTAARVIGVIGIPYNS